MHRPKLILRRHGSMTFGLGYFQDGVWIDHLDADPPIEESADGRATEGEAATIEAVHDWFSCCADRVELELPVAQPAGAVPTFGANFQAVAATAER